MLVDKGSNIQKIYEYGTINKIDMSSVFTSLEDIDDLYEYELNKFSRYVFLATLIDRKNIIMTKIREYLSNKTRVERGEILDDLDYIQGFQFNQNGGYSLYYFGYDGKIHNINLENVKDELFLECMSEFDTLAKDFHNSNYDVKV